MTDLKGFISSSNDLNFRYNNDNDFEMEAEKLVNHLIDKFKNCVEFFVF